jgi:hypothetical protein
MGWWSRICCCARSVRQRQQSLRCLPQRRLNTTWMSSSVSPLKWQGCSTSQSSWLTRSAHTTFTISTNRSAIQDAQPFYHLAPFTVWNPRKCGEFGVDALVPLLSMQNPHAGCLQQRPGETPIVYCGSSLGMLPRICTEGFWEGERNGRRMWALGVRHV